jgi:hypothetical protein
MRLLQIRNKAAPSEIIPNVTILSNQLGVRVILISSRSPIEIKIKPILRVEFVASPPYCKGQNGLAERANRIIRYRINTLSSDANFLLPGGLFEAARYSMIFQKKTPHEVIYGSHRIYICDG